MLGFLLLVVVSQILDDPAVKQHAIEFARNLLDDKALQQQGSDALWSTIKGTFGFKGQKVAPS
jgi:hypothetical protein